MFSLYTAQSYHFFHILVIFKEYTLPVKVSLLGCLILHSTHCQEELSRSETLSKWGSKVYSQSTFICGEWRLIIAI